MGSAVFEVRIRSRLAVVKKVCLTNRQDLFS